KVLPWPTFVVDVRGLILDVNDAALSIYETRSKADLLGKVAVDVLVADEDRAETGVHLQEVLEGADSGNCKVTLVTQAGRKQTYWRAATLRGQGGKLEGAIVTVQDMGEIKALAGATGAAGGAEHLSGALGASGMALFCVDTEGKVLEWTPKTEKLTGFSSGQAQGRDAAFCVPEHFQRSIKKALDQALRGLDVARFNVELSTSSGKAKEAWLSMAPWRSATGRIVGAVGSFEDAAEVDRRLGEAQWIREATGEQLDRANALIFSIDSNMCINEWNYRLADVTGKEKESVAGHKLGDVVLGGSKKLTEDAAAAALAGELAPTVQISLSAGVDMVVGFSPQFSFAGKVVGALAIGQLVTNSSRQMEPSTSRKTKVMVLHELRSPLHGIIGLANTLSQEPGPIQKPLAMIGWSA
ncbi:unnamed protein product, partial [Effrenium voratum]